MGDMKVADSRPEKKKTGPKAGVQAAAVMAEARAVLKENPGKWVNIIDFTSNYGYVWAAKAREDYPGWEIAVEADRRDGRVVGTQVWGTTKRKAK